MEFQSDLFGLGAFLFGATIIGQLLASRAEVSPRVWFWVTVSWGAALGTFAALLILEGELTLRLAGAAASGAAGFATGCGVTYAFARRGWLEDSQERDQHSFRRDVALLGGGIAAATGALAGGSGGYGTAWLNLVGGFFVPPLVVMTLHILGSRTWPGNGLLLVAPNVIIGMGWGSFLGSVLAG